MPDINFYEVSKDYIAYLKKFDSSIPNISYDKHDKFVCGVVLSINGLNYFAPVSSFNKQQKTNLLILNENKSGISSIRFSFMFPAPKEVLSIKDFKKEDEKYKYLLMHELEFCNRHKDEIYKKAQYIYKRVLSGHDEIMMKNCCNFKLLEQKCIEYEKYSSITQTAATRDVPPEDQQKLSIMAKLRDIKENSKGKGYEINNKNLEK